MTNVDTSVARIHDCAKELGDRVGEVVVGKRSAIDLLMVALLSDGHVLLDDVPGVGKTTLARAAARCLDCSFSRIQCTPDLLPSDVLGVHVYNQATAQFVYHQGPLMANIVLVDEINRATPRTQSSMLEAMQERQITVETSTLKLPRPFLVIATQNPVEMSGTYPLPEAQLDRFLLRLKLGYPAEAEETTMLRNHRAGNPMERLEPLLRADELIDLQAQCRKVHVAEDVESYLVRLVRATREDPRIELGASPRATLALYAASQALAAVQGRSYVLPDDVKALFLPVLGHRVVLAADERLRGRSEEDVLNAILSEVATPVVAER